ncbi:3-ketoacyl-CoA reductase, partial [Myxozyma melibiosi]
MSSVAAKLTSLLDSYIASLQESKTLAWFSIAFAVLGFVKYLSFGLKFTTLLAQLTIIPGRSLKKYGAKKGAWAIVTGASDGIGKEYALQLAKAGFNLVLVSRTQSKLSTLATDISTKYTNSSIKTLAIDFSSATDADYDALKALVGGLEIGVLVNNVGQSHSIPVPFAVVDEQELKDIVTINDLATLRVTRIVLPQMLAAKRGLVLTMGSFGGYFPTPYLSVYSGSKAFLQHWSAALAKEVEGTGVDVEFVLSYLVTSAMSKIRRTSALIPSPKSFVASTLSSIGLARGASTVRYTSTPYWSHALFQFVVDATVGAWSNIVAQSNLKMHVQIRKRALKKAEREKK